MSDLNSKYNKIMELYNAAKLQYETDMQSDDNDKRYYANQYLRTDIENYETDLLNIYNSMLELLKSGDNTISQLKDKTTALKTQNNTILDDIDKLKSSSANMNGYIDNNIMLTTSLHTQHNYNIMYKIICLILIIILLCIAFTYFI